MQTEIEKLQPGDKFKFRGDWQTGKGVWRVVEHARDLPYMTFCEPVEGTFEEASNFFSRGVSVVLVK